jgi:hypothetical protein
MFGAFSLKNNPIDHLIQNIKKGNGWLSKDIGGLL